MATAEKVLKEPLSSDVSKNSLNLLICGYIRGLFNKQQDIAHLFVLCSEYYAKPLYAIVFDNHTLKLQLLDVSTNDTGITSNNVKILNNEQKEADFSRLKGGAICHKRDVNIPQLSKKIVANENIDFNTKYNAIFKVTKKCGLVLYPNDITSSDFDTYYYKLPDTPFNIRQRTDAIYSEKYGLILLATGVGDPNKAEFGNIYSLDINDKQDNEEMKWISNKLPKPLQFVYHFPGNYCLINNNEAELFIVNGQIDNKNCIKQTSIYNLETKEYKILKENSKANSHCGIRYNYNSNKVYIGGGQGAGRGGVYYYDLHKNEYYFTIFMYGMNKYWNPVLYLDEGGQILHIASFDKCIRHEWIDLRENRMQPKYAEPNWISNKTVAHFDLWTEQQKYYYMTLIGFQ